MDKKGHDKKKRKIKAELNILHKWIIFKET